MGTRAVGIDTVDIVRFRAVLKKKGAADKFFKNTFSEIENDYCNAYRDPAPHFAGTFAAKEAVIKALGKFPFPLSLLEIRREKGIPAVWIKGRRAKDLLVSITHSRTIACAIALKNS